MIGINQLEGKEKPLEKQLTLTRTKVDQNGNKSFEVQGIVKKKIFFGSRPTPIMGAKKLKHAKANED